MSAYPWGWTTPNAGTFNLRDTGSFAGDALLFQENGTPPVPNASPHDWAALVAGQTPPTDHELGPDHRGPQDPAVVCPADGAAPPTCDDGAFGKGTGGQLRWQVRLEANRPTTLWFAVAGSDKGVPAARAELTKALADPAGALADKVASRKEWDAHTQVDLPGDPLLERSIAWSKQNLADSVQEAHDLQLRPVKEGNEYPPAQGTLANGTLAGRRLAGLPLAVRHRRRVHRLRQRGHGPVRRHQGPPRGVARRQRRGQRHQRQGGARGHVGRIDLLRHARLGRQHRRDLQVPQRRRARLAVDRRRRVP